MEQFFMFALSTYNMMSLLSLCAFYLPKMVCEKNRAVSLSLFWAKLGSPKNVQKGKLGTDTCLAKKSRCFPSLVAYN